MIQIVCHRRQLQPTTENDDAKESAMPFEAGKLDTQNTDRGGCESTSWTLRKEARQLEAITGTKVEWPALAKLRRVRAEVALSTINRTKTVIKSQNGYCRNLSALLQASIKQCS